MASTEPPPRRWSRTRIRLDRSAYEITGTTWLLTVVTHDRSARQLADDAFVADIVEALVRAHQLHGCRLLAFCVMPDHLQLVTVIEDGGSLVKLVNSFKAYSTMIWQRDKRGPLWQRSFHDRGLRTEQDIEAALAYVWENPLRAGLTEDLAEHHWIGGELWG